MPDSHANVFLHFVWATKHREDAIPSNLEYELYRIISGEALRLRCPILALGGTTNHLHLLVKFSRTVTFARFMDQVKGVSSAFLNDRLPPNLDNPEKVFRWQPGYGVFSVGPNQTDAVIAYIRKQKEHHSTGSIRDAWEPPDDPFSPVRAPGS